MLGFVDIDAGIGEKDRNHLGVAVLTCNQKGAEICAEELVGVHRRYLEEFLDDFGMAFPTGTVERSRSTPGEEVVVNAGVVDEELGSQVVSFLVILFTLMRSQARRISTSLGLLFSQAT